MRSARKRTIDNLDFVLVPFAEYKRLATLDNRNKLTRADLALRYNVSRATLVRKPWLLPNCDIPSKGIRSYKWTREEVEDWETLSDKEKQRRYQVYLETNKANMATDKANMAN